MKYKTAFRLGLKLIGVWLCVSSIDELLQFGANAWEWASGARSYIPGLWVPFLLVEAGVKILVGGYLFFGGRWIVDRAIPSNRPYCHECGYELTGMPLEGACPECGTPYQRKPSAPR